MESSLVGYFNWDTTSQILYVILIVLENYDQDISKLCILIHRDTLILTSTPTTMIVPSDGAEEIRESMGEIVHPSNSLVRDIRYKWSK